MPQFAGFGNKPVFVASDPVAYKLRPQPRLGGDARKAPPKNATTAEGFDTTTANERAAAAAIVVSGKQLGKTIASLGSPSEPGFWAKTTLVAAQTAGRLVDPATGKSVQVTLIPIEGPKTAGSRVSLAAMRVLGVSLTGLPKLEVWSGG